MSSYYLTVRHKETGKLYEALALDDAFGRREYGYSIGSHQPCMRAAEFFAQYERVNSHSEDMLDMVKKHPASLCNKPDDLSCQVHAQIAPRIDVVTAPDVAMGGERCEKA